MSRCQDALTSADLSNSQDTHRHTLHALALGSWRVSGGVHAPVVDGFTPEPQQLLRETIVVADWGPFRDSGMSKGHTDARERLSVIASNCRRCYDAETVPIRAGAA